MQSCFSPDKQDEQALIDATGNQNVQNSTFQVRTVKGSSSLIEATPVWGLPQKLVYEFEVCLVSRQNRNIRNREFIVKDGNKNLVKDFTDFNGCLIWYENIEYDYLAKPHYLELSRTIEGSGLYRGRRNIKVAINPWAKGRQEQVKEVYFMREVENSALVFENTILRDRESIKTALNGGFGRAEGLPRIFVDNITYGTHVNNYTSVDGIGGASMNIHVEMNPKLVLSSLSQSNVEFHQLDQGKFNLELFLVSRVEREGKIRRHVLNHYKTEETIDVINGKLSFNYDDVFHLLSYEGQLELGVRLVPHSSLSEVQGFQGLFLLGKYDRRIGFNSARLQRGQNQGYGLTNSDFNNLFSGRDIFEELKDGEFDVVDGIRIIRPFIYSLADFRFVSIENDTPLRRTISYRVKTCVQEELDRDRVHYQVFEVELPNGSKIYPQLGDDGCLLWSDQLTHDYYIPEKLYKRVYKIKHMASNYESQITGYLNPWDPGWTFGREGREINPGATDPTKVFSKTDRQKYEDEYIRSINHRPTENSELFMSGYGYETIGFNYEIDEFMSLYVKKKILLRAHAYVKRYNSLAYGLRAVEPLRDGIYLIRVAIHKKYYDPTYCIDVVPKERTEYVTVAEHHGFEESQDEFHAEAKLSNRCDANSTEAQKTFVDVVKKLVKVEYGQIITPIELTVRNLSLKRIRAQLLLQIEPVDLDKLKLVDMMLKRGEIDQDHALARAYNFASNRVNISRLNRYIKNNQIDFAELTDRHGSIKKAWNEIETGVKKEQRDADDKILTVFDSVAAARENARSSQGISLERFNEGAPFTIDESFLGGVIKEDSHLELNSRDNVDEVVWHGDTAENKGLVSRTFVGPIQLLSSRFGPPVRATDGIDGDIYYEKGNGHTGSSDDLANVKIADLEALKRETERKYKIEKKYESLLFNFTDRYNLDFASLGYREEKLKSITVDTKERLMSECDLENFERDCLRIATRNNLGYNKMMRYMRFSNINHLINHGFNFDEVEKIQKVIDEGSVVSINRRGVKTIDQDFDKFGRQNLKNLIRRGETSRGLAYRMCYYFTFHNFNESLNGKWGTYHPSTNSRRSRPVSLKDANRDDLIEVFKDCAEKASKNFSDIFVINRQLRVHEIDKEDTRFVTGKSLNMNTGSNFGFSSGTRLDTSFSAGGSPTKFLDSLLKGFEKWIPGISLVTGVATSAVNIDYRSSSGVSDGVGSGTSVSTGVYLVVQRATFDIFFKSYELCSTIRMRPEYIDRTVYPKIFKGLDNESFKAAATRGLFLCNGDRQRSGNIASREYFYYFAQHFTAGDMLDDQDLRNHPWLLLLRGERDFLNFIENIKAYRPEDKEKAEDPKFLAGLYKNLAEMHLKDEQLFNNNPAADVSLGQWPIEQLINAYKNVLPTFPGIYNLRPNKEEYPPYPYTR